MDISQDEHSSLLAEVEKTITDVENRYYVQERVQIAYLKELLQKKTFGAVLDGMNVAMAGMRITINIPQVNLIKGGNFYIKGGTTEEVGVGLDTISGCIQKGSALDSLPPSNCCFLWQLVEVAKESVAETGLPVLIVLRQHCTRNFPVYSAVKSKSISQVSDDINRFYQEENIQFYFIYNL